MMHASNDNPILENPRLAGLTSWDAPWAGLRVVVAGIGVSGFAAADTLIELGALVTVRASRAAAAQRAGRAGREAPGRVYRLWSAAEQDRLPAAAEPEIAVADLTGT